MDARSSRIVGCPWGGRRLAVVIAIVAATARAEDSPSATTPPFQPGEISIGEPIALPFGGRAAAPTASSSATPANDPRVALPQATTAGTATVPGSGWLGLAVAESSVPGRWRVEDVTADGPAARAGIAVGDELRAVNGSTLSSADAVSQALTAIAAGQDVRVAVARGDQVTDVVLRAESRPPVRPADLAAAKPSPEPTPTPAPSPFPTTSPAAAVPTPPAEPATVLPAAGTSWQAADQSRPLESGSRFASQPQPAVAPAPAAAPVRNSPPTAASGVAPGRFVPPPAAEPKGKAIGGRTALGVRTVPIDPVTQARFQLREPAGAYVIGVVEGLPAGKAGVPPGSVIVAVGDQPVRSPVELTRLVTSGPLDRPVPVEFVLPGGEAKRANVVLQALDAPLERVLTGASADGTSPTLRPAPLPRRAERPAGPESGMLPDVRAEIRAEIRALRGRLERLERLLEPTSRSGR